MSEEWFRKKIGKTSPAFEKWWADFYGKPEDFADSQLGCDYCGTLGPCERHSVSRQSERDDFWTRKGFAWHGWEAAKESRR